jgi:hypothetical protein
VSLGRPYGLPVRHAASFVPGTEAASGPGAPQPGAPGADP